jgi:glutathione S-transferase
MAATQAIPRRYELHYWPSIQGRGEFIRLALEEAGAPYVDVARLPEGEGGGERALLAFLKDTAHALPPFAPPVLRAGGLVIAQTANILLYLGPRLRLVPEDEAGRLAVHQLQLTLADFAGEAHDTHHPIAASLYYEDQKTEALRRAAAFVAERLPKFLRYFERVLTRNERGAGRHLVGAELSYADLSLAQVLWGLDYAFPRALTRLSPEIPRCLELRDRVAERPRIAAYLASERRLPFNQHGLFRNYPELDAEPET